MRRLILMRHGKAEFAGATGGDRERPLSDRGRREALLTAGWLRGAGFTPDLAYISTSTRTLETWACASAVFAETRVQACAELYLASVDTILDVLDTVPPGNDTILVVGHNPGLQELGLQLALESGAAEAQVNRIAEGFPTATACVFRVHSLRAAALEGVFEPPGREGSAPRWTFVHDGRDNPA